MKLSFYKSKWFVTYKGLIYGNQPTNVILRIYNKSCIDKQLTPIK